MIWWNKYGYVLDSYDHSLNQHFQEMFKYFPVKTNPSQYDFFKTFLFSEYST